MSDWGQPVPLWTGSWPTQPREDTMGLNVNESHAVNRVLDWVDALHQSGQQIPGDVRQELALLADSAYKRLSAGWRCDGVETALGDAPPLEWSS